MIYDVVVIGGGPGGISASIGAASEGLKTVLIDSSTLSQTKNSIIENYPGFPGGVSSSVLMDLFLVQAKHFGVEFLWPTVARGIGRSDGCLFVSTDNSSCPKLLTKTVVVAVGVDPARTRGLNCILDRTDEGYIITGEYGLLPFETSMDSVFAIGDVRDGSVKHAVAAVGEGIVVVQQILRRISTL